MANNNVQVHSAEGLAYWAKLDRPHPNKFSQYETDAHQYSIVLYLDARNKKLMESLKHATTIKQDENGDRFNFVLNYMTKAGKSMVPPKVLDCDLNDVTQSVLIGNGSKVEVEFALLDIQGGAHAGKTKAFLRNVQIIDLVPYEGSGAPVNTLKKRSDGYVATDQQNLEEVA
jgi:hypothetical protein